MSRYSDSSLMSGLGRIRVHRRRVHRHGRGFFDGFINAIKDKITHPLSTAASFIPYAGSIAGPGLRHLGIGRRRRVHRRRVHRHGRGPLLDKIKSGLSKIHNFVKDNRLVSRGLSHIPHKYAQMASVVANHAGYGRRKRRVVHRRRHHGGFVAPMYMTAMGRRRKRIVHHKRGRGILL
jgi:hypothetical protein